jgi:Tfp pilus assembly protein PilF
MIRATVRQYLQLGIEHHKAGRFAEAEEIYRQILAKQPDNPDAQHMLGVIAQQSGRLDAAIELISKAITINPKIAEYHCNLGNALREMGKPQDAINAYRQALQLNSGSAQFHYNLGNALSDLALFEEGIESYEEALRLEPGLARVHWNLALNLLVLGDFARGWREYEWRWRWSEFVSRRQIPQPRWDGTDLNGKTILLHAEQGIGDTIQFIRYLPMVAARGGRIILECPAPLHRLFQQFAGIEKLIIAGHPLPNFDVHCPLMSLPFVFSTTLETIPAPVPYLSADTELSAAWTARLAGSARLKVGIAWAGNPRHHNDRNRSIPSPLFAPLARAKGIAFHSLQKRIGAADHVLAPTVLNLIDHSADLNDFADTAALIASLDLVISVDTAVAHLTGAMGKPTWLLLPYAPDWRWLLHRENSPWYPTMRLFRQKRLGDWKEVIERVLAALQTNQIA